MQTIKHPAPLAAPPWLEGRLAGGPISWGVCEVPGWGAELPPERVLREMRSVGLTATEAGPAGYLGTDLATVSRRLEQAGLRLVGAFVPAVLHEPDALAGTLESVRRQADLLAAAGATHLVSAAVVDLAWSPRTPLRERAWGTLLQGLDQLDDLARAAGLEHVLHPHVGTLVETDAELRRVLAGGDVRICLDTGHLGLGGCDLVELVRTWGTRVGHVHLKDVRAAVARRLHDGALDLVGATRAGLFCPLGDGDLPVAEVVEALELGGYPGWYVLEQDTTLESAELPEGAGPVLDAARSVEFLRRCRAPRRHGPGTPEEVG